MQQGKGSLQELRLLSPVRFYCIHPSNADVPSSQQTNGSGPTHKSAFEKKICKVRSSSERLASLLPAPFECQNLICICHHGIVTLPTLLENTPLPCRPQSVFQLLMVGRCSSSELLAPKCDFSFVHFFLFGVFFVFGYCLVGIRSWWSWRSDWRPRLKSFLRYNLLGMQRDLRRTCVVLLFHEGCILPCIGV